MDGDGGLKQKRAICGIHHVGDAPPTGFRSTERGARLAGYGWSVFDAPAGLN
jgi:hypothetical protein